MSGVTNKKKKSIWVTGNCRLPDVESDFRSSTKTICILNRWAISVLCVSVRVRVYIHAHVHTPWWMCGGKRNFWELVFSFSGLWGWTQAIRVLWQPLLPCELSHQDFVCRFTLGKLKTSQAVLLEQCLSTVYCNCAVVCLVSQDSVWGMNHSTLHSVFQTNQSNNQQSNFEAVQSGKKKKKQKMVRADPSLLGFSVNASSERLNMGEIETLDDYWVPAVVPAFPLLPSDRGFSSLDKTCIHHLLCHSATNHRTNHLRLFFPP